MSKPLGIGFGVRDGEITLRVNSPSRWEDKLWDAVEEAITANVTPERWKKEVIAAWSETLSKFARYDVDEVRKP